MEYAPFTSTCPFSHFRITSGFFFKASLGAHPFICKSIFIHTQRKPISTWIKIDLHKKQSKKHCYVLFSMLHIFLYAKVPVSLHATFLGNDRGGEFPPFTTLSLQLLSISRRLERIFDVTSRRHHEHHDSQHYNCYGSKLLDAQISYTMIGQAAVANQCTDQNPSS